MSYIPPTEKEKELLRGFSKQTISEFNEPDVLYVQDIRYKLIAVSNGIPINRNNDIEDLYGIKLTFDETGFGVMPTYTVTDEQKYLMFLMKF